MHLLNPTGLLKLSFGPNWVQETKTFIIYEISRMLLSNMDFSLAHFANFNFAHFCNWRKFWVSLGKITKWSISPQIFISVACFKYGLYFFPHFVYNWSFGKIWVTIKEWFIRIENFDFGTRFTNYGAPFCSFWT